MKTKLGAVLGCLLLAPACSGSDIDLGNGGDGVLTGGAGSAATAGSGGSSGTGQGTGSVSGSTSGSSAVTGATTGSSAATGSGTTAGSSGSTTGTSGSTTGTSGSTTGTSGSTTGTSGTNSGTSATSGPTPTGNTTVGSGTTTGGSGGAGGLQGAGDGGLPPSSGTTAIVMRYADIPFSSGSGSGSTSSTGGGPGIDPDTAYVFVGNAPPTCSAPFAQPSCGTFLVTVGIPRALFVPGTLALNDRRLISTMSVRGPDRGGGDCYGGGGSFFDGTLQIVQSGSSLSVRFANTSTIEFNVNGSHSVESCPMTDGGTSTMTGGSTTTGSSPTGSSTTGSPTGGSSTTGSPTSSTVTGTPPTGGTTGTPLVLAFHGERVSFTRAAGSFDLFGRSASVETDWVSSETPWLALDRDGNGRIDDGRELFGSMTELPDGTTASNGFAALAPLDDDHDGWITERDEAFARLVVWRDRNQDRISTADELVSAREAGLVAIALEYRNAPRCGEAACEMERGGFVFRDERNVERRGDVVDVHLWSR